VPTAIAFRVDPEKVAGLSAQEKLSSVNGAIRLVTLRKRIAAEGQAELERSQDACTNRLIEQEMERPQREAGKLYREIAPSERKPPTQGG